MGEKGRRRRRRNRINSLSISLSFILATVVLKRLHHQEERRDMSQTVVLKVAMPCEGCVGAVKRVLGKMQGVESFDVDLKEQKVTVKGNVEPEAVLQTVSKTGKKTSFWGADEAETAKA
ncbi:BnaC02g02620D [Brassica napus]|uniref:BnaC02g02620D protein n=1 Tax=Brassica napus TaxID=3708 RepID=A0A078FI90_BRANA|nr:BnaC02g02620D [Brassica napus]